MNAAVASATNSTIVRAISSPALLRAYFGVTSRLFPAVAGRQAEHVFTAPPRYAGRAVEPYGSRRSHVVVGRHRLAVWQAGRMEARPVLLSHGWGGRGVQMAAFVEPLVASGYRPVWFDHAGHGESGHGRVALPDFVRAVEALSHEHGPFAGAIGHSLGGAAIGVAVRNGLPVDRLAFLSAPASITEYTHRFARYLGIPPTVRDAMRRRLERRYGMPFEEIDRIDELARVSVPALFVHDRQDQEVPFDHALRLASRMPNARLVRTHGLGHHRLLRDRAVVDAVVGFIARAATELPEDLPRLPRPAPLY